MISFEFGFLFGLALGWQFFTRGEGTDTEQDGIEVMLILPFIHITFEFPFGFKKINKGENNEL